MTSLFRTRTTRVLAVAAASCVSLAGVPALASSPSAAAPSLLAPARAADPVSPTTLPGGLELSTASIEDLQAGLEAGDFTSVELVEAYLARIDAINYDGPRLNAVRQSSATALAEARASDEARADGDELGPMAGIPILIKDNIDAAGLPTTAGSVALANSYPAADAPLVASLRESGAIILGKLNLTEFANYTTSGMPAGYSCSAGRCSTPTISRRRRAGPAPGPASRRRPRCRPPPSAPRRPGRSSARRTPTRWSASSRPSG